MWEKICMRFLAKEWILLYYDQLANSADSWDTLANLDLQWLQKGFHRALLICKCLFIFLFQDIMWPSSKR